MYKGFESKHGMSATIFKNYDNVYTGHYHTKSTKGNITYVGTPYEECWHDSGDERGFYILDQNKPKLKFIKNSFTLFEKILYNESSDQDYMDDSYLQRFENKYIKIIIDDKTDAKFDLFFEKLNNIPNYGITIIDKQQDMIDLMQDVDETSDTVSILNTYIDNTISDGLDTSTIKSIMFEVYNSALKQSVYNVNDL